jgi:hypothetical protein
LETTRWKRGFSCEAPGLENPIICEPFCLIASKLPSL